ncbi:PIG-L family deacetylase [Paramicrobacterium fandaimingii]|uniref:PIG-L family deacetylase n=1 Tax=Paramicrobacterium fandaimingii TaxID=2708079 RepID=UPI00141F209D|nr:PIG-L family deacetylase [Microbacterium fandaimingii]
MPHGGTSSESDESQGLAHGFDTDGTVLDDVRHVLFVHAHPDDETLATGALMAELIDRDILVTLVTCTRGERGEVVPGPLSHLQGMPEFAAHRENELAGALAELGVTRHVWLGTPPARVAQLEPRRYEDSGMRWVREGLAGPAADASANALTSQPLADETADLLAFVDAAHTAPDLVVSYNEIGGYGHPDHMRARKVAEAAARARGIRFAEILSDAALAQKAQDAGELATWFHLDHRLDQVKAALAHHASQVSVDGDDVVHSGGQRTPIGTSVGLRLVL